MSFPRPSHPWIAEFAGHLLKLDPGMSATYAVQCAVANIHQAGHLPPAEAARVVASDRVRPAERAAHSAQSERYRERFSAG